MEYEVNKLYRWKITQPPLHDTDFIKIIKISKRYILYTYPFIQDRDAPNIFSCLNVNETFIKVNMSTTEYLQRRKF